MSLRRIFAFLRRADLSFLTLLTIYSCTAVGPLIERISLNIFNDLHHVVFYERNLFIVITGLDLVIKYSLDEKKIKTFNPKKASRLSAVLPGLGQIYNKQYWKVPVIYGGYAVIGHYIKFNNSMYNDFKNALTLETAVSYTHLTLPTKA